MDDIQVFHRSGQWCPGRRVGDVVAYDVKILPKYQVPGRPTVDRSYLLLNEGIQLTKPAVFEGPVEGWWYVDLVEIDHTDAGLVVRDLYVDLLIPPAANRYQLLDLDEFADALSTGQITPTQCATVLTQTQHFINHYLRGEAEGPIGESRAFPPAEVVALEQLPSLLEEPA
ncbi:uncharacterized protein DUF402 [Kribbella rubisoli]|uniref:Uncharacterized protein DUF402 n=1 Tax=Kribbella rubisoli TaxID=3075929 RepID=A0A4Q7WUL2_9ACTN|nr:DUF402 domain-containing protein [Kribbella rubisoli]RZU13693.1 uncharacterized protein DUF402 [Kribbella rubisoli]